MALNQQELLDLLVQAVEDSGWRSLVYQRHKPFGLRVYKSAASQDGSADFALSAYIWNCTHGGGPARADDEYRVQLTGVVPTEDDRVLTLLLGWHSGYEVFVAFDIRRHDGQASASPSIQIKEATLRDAHTNAFAVHTRQNGEIAVAFRPEFLVDYALNARELHTTGQPSEDVRLLNDIEHISETDIAAITSYERQKVVAKIVRKYRASDFTRRVLGAYNRTCAMCGVQLALIDAAHIIPVAADTSTDETKNGIALCKLHHAAFDRNLVSFDEAYRIHVSEVEVDRLNQKDLSSGLRQFREALLPVIRMPHDRRDYPPNIYISEARKVRGWMT